ncbi:hypothetical protein DdX_15742 [Ditylenchus destructor]|uniref:F-box domain-containing protein n=1 Tax=Ditylenchus destructor TaxID=166010 RepID=A0AAD4MUV1_9BILA|nr:hypothetical protein DdX_15742 [Ditylenchus destructor]
MAARLAEKIENETPEEPKAKKSRSDDRTSNIATLDNGTMVESLKYLNYMQLAKSSLVSKRFSNLIRTNRHRLALLYVDYISMLETSYNPTYIKVFGKELSPGEYNEWVIRDRHSKEIPLDGPVAEMRRKVYRGQVYEMMADYKELNHYNWPVFQHFVRLITAPFIYINYLQMTPLIQISFVNLLAGALNLDSNRMQCGRVVLFSSTVNLGDNVRKFIDWTKNNVHCKEFQVAHQSILNFDDELLEFLTSGAHCTSAIMIKHSDMSDVIVAFLQKFMELKECDENQMVESIRCDGAERVVEPLLLLSEGRRDNIEDNIHKFIGWIKNHVLCKEFRVSHDSDTNFDEEVLDFLMTGAHCTSAILMNRSSDFSHVIVAFLQKFMSLQDCDENQMVESIQCRGSGQVVEVLNSDYAKFIDKKENGKDQCIELFNTRIGKKLKISARMTAGRWIYFLLDIKNL